MRESNVSSSDDLALAKRLSQQLTGSAPTVATIKTPVPAPHAEPFARLGVAPRRPTFEHGAAGWNLLLAECLTVSGGTAAFAIDLSGLLVASSGAIDTGETESMGSRLAVVLEQVGRMFDEPTRTITIEVGARVITAFRFSWGDQPVAVVVISRTPLHEAARLALHGLLHRPSR